MNIILTGASTGIGCETAKVLALNSNHKIILIARNASKLDQVKYQCKEINPNSNVITIPFDLSDSDFTPLLEILKTHLNSVNYLINNAGILINKSFEETSYQDLFNTFNTNLFSVFKITQLLLPMFTNPSHIVNIGSMGGFQGSSKFIGLAAYSASKAALANFTECLAEEFREKGINVNCLALGSVQTDMLNNVFPGYKANVTASEMARYIAEFTLYGYKFYNGKILPVSLNTP